MLLSPMESLRLKVFISYSHRDRAWLDRLLEVLGEHWESKLWEDTALQAGDDWFEKIQEALDECTGALLLVSHDFLASSFINSHELPFLLERAEERGTRVIPIVLHSCPWADIPWISRLQIALNGSSITHRPDGMEERLQSLGFELEELFSRPQQIPNAAQGGEKTGPKSVDLGNLPVGQHPIFGREAMRETLLDWWHAEEVRLVQIVGEPAAGASEFLGNWLNWMRLDAFSGAERVFCWSFDVADPKASVELFLLYLLQTLELPVEDLGSPQRRALAIADALRKERCLLVLDGVTALLEGGQAAGEEEAQLTDIGLRTLLEAISEEQGGMCVLSTSRPLSLPGVRGEGAPQQLDLVTIDTAAARALLRVGGLPYPDGLLDKIITPLDENVSALRLFAALYALTKQDRTIIDWIPLLQAPKTLQEGAVAGVTKLLFEHLERRHLALLELFAFFDGFTTPCAAEALRHAQDETERKLWPELGDLDKQAWGSLLEQHQKAGLLLRRVEEEEELGLEASLRQHLLGSLEQRDPLRKIESHRFLYRFYLERAVETPKTLKEMGSLFRALREGAAAGRYDEALEDVYKDRMNRGGRFFLASRLGAVDASLMALRPMFRVPFVRSDAHLSPKNQSYVLHEAGVLQSTRADLEKAAQALEEACVLLHSLGDPKELARSSGKLTEVYIWLGRLDEALEAGRVAFEAATQSGSAFRILRATALLGRVEHYRGKVPSAQAYFEDAEAREQVRDGVPYLAGFWGYWYLDFLLEQGRAQEVAERVEALLNHTWKYPPSLLARGTYQLAVGRAELLHCRRSDAAGRAELAGQAAKSLTEAGRILAEAGHQEYLIGASLALTEALLWCGEHHEARALAAHAFGTAQQAKMPRELLSASTAILVMDAGGSERSLNEGHVRVLLSGLGAPRSSPRSLELLQSWSRAAQEKR